MRNFPGDSLGDAQRRALFWPPTKIVGRYLSPYLAELDRAEAIGEVPQPSGQPVDLDLDVPAWAGVQHVNTGPALSVPTASTLTSRSNT
jgi:hypothetical protein